MIKITELNSVYIQIDCEKSVAKELSSFFTFRVPNFQYTPAYKNRLWDGKIRLFNMINGYLYRGLLSYLFDFMKERNYPFELHPKYPIESHTNEIIEEFISSLDVKSNNIPIQFYDHQIEAIKESIKRKRLLLVSPTGSGKSLIIYALIQWLLQNLDPAKKILIIPTTK